MSVKKILEVYDEFQAICSIAGDKATVYETLEIVEVVIEKGFTFELIKDLYEKSNDFDVLCNPFPDSCEDIIYDIEQGSFEISEIDSIRILFEKNIEIENIGNLDFFFFDHQSAVESIEAIVENHQAIKKNIGIINDERIETETVVFMPLNQTVKLNEIEKVTIKPHIDESIKFYLSNNKKSNHSYFFNPYSFNIINNTGNESFIRNLIEKKFYLVFMESISDKSENDTYIIRGDKTISIIKNEDFSTKNISNLMEILDFLVTAQKYTEKFIITKKVFSLYIFNNENLTELDKKIPNIWKTINHYYNHYIEDNIKDFFKTKDQLLKEAMNVSKVIYEQTDKINTSIVASLISVVILYVTTIYRSISGITVTYFLLLLVVFLLFSIVYYSLMKNSSIKRFELTKKQFEYFISEISTMRGEEISILEDTYLDEPYNELKNTLSVLRNILFGINFLSSYVFLLFLCLKGYYCLC